MAYGVKCQGFVWEIQKKIEKERENWKLTGVLEKLENEGERNEKWVRKKL